jgi:tetratricopeptide (TPR) repeat protein
MQARPICFMVMPYGTKLTQQREGIPAPAAVDFDRLWELAIRPALVALGYDPVRADQDLGALIIHEMIERLAVSDLVVADVSIPNGNVYYEVGIRHAAKQSGCVMISAGWAQPLFDIQQMRQIRYPLPAAQVDDATVARIRELLQTTIPNLAQGASPFYTVLPGYPDQFDATRTSTFRTTLQELSSFQAAVVAARVAPPGERRARALELRQQYGTSRPIRSVVAMELLYLLRDCTDWQTLLEFVDGLPGEMRALPVVQEQKALAQSNSGDHATAIGALFELIRLNGDSSERRGLLGGRYKRLYQEASDKAIKDGYLDQAIREYDLGMHLDLNDYYPSSNLPRLYRIRKRRGDEDRARIAAAITLVACQRARSRNSNDEWLKPTLLGAAFDAGDVEAAQDLADDARAEGPAAWQLAATLADLKLAITLHEGERATALNEILTGLTALLPADAVTRG